ncbi:MAG: alkaline phosphatase D family protein [Actinobacteria bacterium]|nr:alkaline phosphatase D family protein [Actinomycetota bacterium]
MSSSSTSNQRPSITRRKVLGGMAAGGAVAALGGAFNPQRLAGANSDGGPYPQGVVSGDPRSDGFNIWTRVRPSGFSDVFPIDWHVSTDPDFSNVVQSGTVQASEAYDHTAKVAVTGLNPYTRYWYRFTAKGQTSPVGRARTAPAPGAPVEKLKIGVCSCANYTSGYYNAYRAMANEDLDYFVHLGDYIYEYNDYGDGVRSDPVAYPKVIEQYRDKYKLYRSDPDLQALHASAPMVAVWDDHEVEDNYNIGEIGFQTAHAYRAWFDYQPTFGPAHDPSRIYRAINWGNLADIFMTDDRQYRDPELPGGNSATGSATLSHADGRTLLGGAQRQWLMSSLGGSAATWKLIGNPVMMMPWRLLDFDSYWTRRPGRWEQMNAGFYLNGDQWDGYQWERRAVLSHIEQNNIKNVVVVTGDLHMFLAGTLRPDFDRPGSQPVAVELVTGSITSPGFDQYLSDPVSLVNDVMGGIFPGMQFADVFRHGYGVLQITRDQIIAELKSVPIDTPNTPTPTVIARFRIPNGQSILDRIGP